MSRTGHSAIPIRLSGRIARNGRVGGGLAAVAVWLLALLAMPLALAEGTGLLVQPTGPRLFTVDPREVVTLVVRVTNRTNEAVQLEGQLSLPRDWRAITPEFPFQLAAGASAMRLVSLLVPESTPAGEYRVGYQVRARENPNIRDGLSLAVRVRPVFKLQVDVVHVPSLAIAGEPYQAQFQISNYSNAALAIGFAANSSRDSAIEPPAGQMTLAPGESRPMELTVQPPAVDEPVRDEISLTASAVEQGLSDTAKRSVETLPRVTGEERPYHHMQTLFTKRLGGSWGEDGGHQGVQLEWQGAGPFDEDGERFLSFLIRGPSLEDETIFGQRDEIYLDYQGRFFDLALGDRSFGLSPLTESGMSGRGVGMGWHGEQSQASVYFVRDRFDDDGGHQAGIGIGHWLRDNWWLGLSLLDKEDDDGRNQIAGLRHLIQLRPGLDLELEVAGSTGDLGDGAAVLANLAQLGEAWRYRLSLLYADERFAGANQDQQRAYLDLDYSPDDQPWGLSAFYHWDKYGPGYAYDPDPDEEREREQELDPELDLTWRGSASEQHEMGVGVHWQTEKGSRYSAELRHRQREGLSGASDLDDVEQSVRLGYGRSFDALDLSLNASVDLGRLEDRTSGDRVSTQGYRASLSWRPSSRASLSAYAYHDNDAVTSEDQENRLTFGLGGAFALDERTDLNINLQGNHDDDQDRFVADGALRYRRNNGHLFELRARHETGERAETNLMLSYSVPVDLPVTRRASVTTLHGRLFDKESDEGLANVVVRMGKLVAITDERGFYMFPSVKRDIYQVEVAGGSLPVGMIPLVEMPVEVNLHMDDDPMMKIPFIQGATIEGVVQLYEPDSKLLPSQTFLRVGQAPPDTTELKPSQGLRGVLVEVKCGDEVYRRLTNGNGQFRFAGLTPGTWTVKMLTDALPENATVEETEYTVEVAPKAEETLEFRVEKKVRRMRMLAPLSVKG
jgi:hypothetical protein